ncbi:uncharacterized protein LAESUDRAFT_654670 [Laetiporus sulphureus 93-53]|uniref:MARVEL domain-containing protein n=1 Tax=Laetiporus sulphureus 93-53 TaxID=1314785 RepID=A0A165DYV9_9APHY|nr:uncharacterized protein LAESUDRAFT_654670 [Laetiporus sulphureus 93-53]KZT05912.1 hypothetical protein LAESUDRAFT_654670 [Laetiporus sulphureus 93-53]
MASDGQRVSSSPSISSFAKSHSVHSSRLAPSTIKTVITAPPWARDEPPSPGDDEPQRGATSSDSFRRPVDYRVSDVTSYESSIPEEPGPSRWWTFARHRPSLSQTTPLNGTPSEPRRPQRDWERSLSLPWLNVSHHLRSQESSLLTARPHETEHRAPEHPQIPADPLHVDIPPPPATPYTIAQNATPGWDTPWTARPADLTSRGHNSGDEVTQLAQADDDSNEKLGTWTRRRKRVRAYMMYNPYVPLLFRFTNIVFTTTALAIAIRIRLIEKKNGVMGAVGCSPTLVIIFASLTLVHVMIAIYVEYFGRPVGLWHTSSKLAYTLIEVVFICAWSAALALSFDNFFTSLIPCASASDISWYNQLPRPTVPGLTGNEGTPGDQICDDQLALICLVGVGLIMYCINLVISLFRIFERVKYHPTLILPS